MNTIMKRVISMVLCFVMVLGFVPANVFAADTTQYLFFATDRHANSTIIDSLLDQMSTVGTVEYACLGGDMVNGTSGFSDTTVLNEVSSGRSQLTAANVDIVAGNHDDNCSNDSGTFHDESGWLYSGEDYHVYGVVYNDLNDASSAQSAAQAFAEWGSDLTDGKVIIVMSHVPLHSTRNNSGANYWHEALNDVAADENGNIVRDVIFLHGHNHTIDEKNYQYAVNEGFTVNNYSGSEPNYYTYGTAGYLNTNNEATLIAINDTTVTLTRYNSSGSTEEYATVTRVASDSTEDGSGTTTESKDVYVLVDTMTVGKDYLIANGNSGTVTLLGQSSGSQATTTANVVTEGDYTYIETADEGYIWNATAHTNSSYSTYPRLINAETYAVYASNGSLAFSNSLTSTSGAIYTRYWTYTDGVMACVSTNNSTTYYLTYSDSKFDMTSSSTTGIYIYEKQTVETEVAITLSSIAVTTTPTTVYNVGDTFSTEGMVVTATYSDGSTAVVTPTSVSTPDMTTAGTKTVTVTYTEGDVTKEATFAITVNELISETATVTGIEVTGGKTEFNLNETFSAEGLVVTATYDDNGTTKTKVLDAADYTVDSSAVNMAAEGEYTVTVSYTFNGTTATDTYTVTVTEAPSNEVTIGSSGVSKEVYVLTDSLTANGEYLIVNTNAAGSGYALLNNSGSVSSVAVTIQTSDDGNYIELDNSGAVWTAVTNSSGYNLTNALNGSTYYLEAFGQTSAIAIATSKSYSSRYWKYSSSALGYYGGTSTHYIYYDGGFVSAKNSGSEAVYIYQKKTISTSSEVTYTMRAEDLKQVVDTTNSVPVTANLSYCLQGNGADLTTLPSDGSYSFAVLSDANGIITSIDTDGTVTFSGTIGTATVKVAYTWTQDGNTYTVYKNITVETVAPYYSIELHKAELTEVSITEFADGVTYYTFDSTTNTYHVAESYVAGTTYYTTPVVEGDVITETIALKGIEEGDKYSVWAVVKEHNAENPDGEDLGDVDDSRLYWTVSNTSIATIDPATGVLNFTGDAYGTINVTVHYLDENGNSLCYDTITISVTNSLYVVPGDGTNDFPEYPTQGAIRFDKTAVAQGNFSATGIAKVELSMTGVPYGTSTPTDVVIMVDMTTSMSNSSSVDDAQTAIENMLEALVYDEENDAYDKNIYVQVWSFKSDNDGEDVAFVENLSRRNITSEQDLANAKKAITFSTSGNDGNGTPYDEATKKLQSIVDSCTTDNVVAVFASDGEPTRYAYLNSSGGATETDSLNSSNWFSSDGSTTSSYLTEYYTYKLKSDKIPVYTVGINITDETEAAWILEHMSSEYDALGTTVSMETANANTDYFFTANANTTTDELSEVFEKIAASIREAATNVVVEDKIDSHYTVNFSLPAGVTATEAGMDDFYIQVLGYELDENNERKENPTVLEKFLFNDDGTIVHTIGSTTCGDTCNHVTKTAAGVVTAIDGTYFDYTVDANGDEFLTWTADKLDRTELALEYFVYLDHSAGDVEAADQVAAGTYNTNEYATITYTNHLGNECQQYFPVPSMTWKGAKVTYVFYLVNSAGQPVSRAGKVIPFAEAVYVTTPVTYDVHWNEATGSENILAKDIFATAGVPEVYELYDKTASYVIRVYQTEDVDNAGVNGNYFEISGANDKLIDSVMDTDTDVDNSTTKVFNTKAGQKYDEYGVYSVYNAGTTLTDGTNTFTTDFKATDIDYANTTVAFAVVWTPSLAPDAVVVDYGLDVVIDVITNDNMAAGVVGVRTEAPSGVSTDGTYKRDEAATKTSVEVYIDADHDTEGLKELKIGTATVENKTSVRFSLDKTNGKQFSAPAEFYYEADVNYYTYDANNTETLNTTSMYSKVTVIPATTIYYEDDFLNFTSYTITRDENGEVVSETLDDSCKWVTKAQSGEQQEDRPGASKISADLDADNNYGYDAAYKAMSEHSLDSAAQITVDANTRGEATFTFWGTGFDVISATSNTSGTLTVQVYAGSSATGDAVKTSIVDTYYGYTRNDDGTWVVNNETENALYQVPVMKIFGMEYGQYTVKITAGYNDFFNHTAAESSYVLYLDAIRIYDPTGDQNDVANDAYIADGEAYPEYFEVRDQIISKNTYDSLNDETVSGIVFIDGAVNGPSIADYTSYGPNNEVYLTNGQAIAFNLNGTYTAPAGMELAKIQLAVKTTGGEGKVEVYGVKADGTKVSCLDETISTATDMYYDITALEGMTVVIKSTGAAIVSITNVKVTYQPAETEAVATASVEETEAPMLFSVSRASADAALVTLCAEKPAEPTEPTEPETEPTEPTEPETTEPEPETTEPEPETTEPEPETTEPETEPTEPETTEPETTEPEENPDYDAIKKAVEKTIKKIVKKLFGWLFG